MKTKVKFIKFKGEIVALFPEIKESNDYILSYAHLGQHSGANKDLLRCKHAAFNEYQFLLKELVNIGYNSLELMDKAIINNCHRKPTNYEINFGHSSAHYLDIPLKEFYNTKKGELKGRIKYNGKFYSRL